MENPQLRLRGEMSGNAKIYCGERRLYEVVFRRVLRFIRVEAGPVGDSLGRQLKTCQAVLESAGNTVPCGP